MTDEKIAQIIYALGFYLADEDLRDGRECSMVLQYAADYFGRQCGFDNRSEVNPCYWLH